VTGMAEAGADRPPLVAAVMADGFEEMELVAPVDILRRAGARVDVLSVDGEGPVTGAHGLAIHPDRPLEGYPSTPSLVLLPGGMPGAARLGASAKARALCQRTLSAGGKVAALCAAPAMALGPWGLLRGRRATCHPSRRSGLPPDAVATDAPVVVDGPVVTARDAGAAAPLGLALVACLFGGDQALAVGRAMGLEYRPVSEP